MEEAKGGYRSPRHPAPEAGRQAGIGGGRGRLEVGKSRPLGGVESCVGSVHVSTPVQLVVALVFLLPNGGNLGSKE
jgi:hypothetical protein